MKALVIYKTKAGHTKRYAEMIAKEIGADYVSIQETGGMDFSGFEMLVYGGSLHAVGIDGYDVFRSRIRTEKDKKVVVFAVGASPKKADIVEEIRKINFSTPEEEGIPLFYLRGGFEYDKLPALDKFLMLLLKVKIQMKKQKTADDLGLLASYKNPLDTVKPENVREIVDYIKRLM